MPAKRKLFVGADLQQFFHYPPVVFERIGLDAHVAFIWIVDKATKSMFKASDSATSAVINTCALVFSTQTSK